MKSACLSCTETSGGGERSCTPALHALTVAACVNNADLVCHVQEKADPALRSASIPMLLLWRMPRRVPA